MLKTAAQLSEGYLSEKVRLVKMWVGRCILFDSDDSQFLSKVDQKVSVEDILQSPVSVNIGSNDLVLSLETLGTHSVNGTLYFRLVGCGPVSLKIG